MSFAQFLALLLAACLLVLGGDSTVLGSLFGGIEAVELSAATFGAAVVLQRRGLAHWLPVAGWMALGFGLANFVLPALTGNPNAGLDDLLPIEPAWIIIFVALLLASAGGWGDGALLALCVATSHAGSLALLLRQSGNLPPAPGEALAQLATSLAGLVVVILMGILLAWFGSRWRRGLAAVGLLSAASHAWMWWQS